MSLLLEPTEIKGLKLPNRFVRSATWEGMATTKGDCTPALIKTMARLAERRVGLIISGHTYVSPEGQATRRAREAGFDGVQIHTAHGHLLSYSDYFSLAGENLSGVVEGKGS